MDGKEYHFRSGIFQEGAMTAPDHLLPTSMNNRVFHPQPSRSIPDSIPNIDPYSSVGHSYPSGCESHIPDPESRPIPSFSDVLIDTWHPERFNALPTSNHITPPGSSWRLASNSHDSSPYRFAMQFPSTIFQFSLGHSDLDIDISTRLGLSPLQGDQESLNSTIFPESTGIPLSRPLSDASSPFVELHSLTPLMSSLSDVPPTAPEMSPTLEEDETENYEQSYAKLIYKALHGAPGHKLPLRDIYEWFKENTNKSKTSISNGWQNSVRHNLSMNAGFVQDKGESSTGKGKINNCWKLSKDAEKNGVQPTTRYRKHGQQKRPMRMAPPAPQRQQSGSKGGRAARLAARSRREIRSLETQNNPQSHPDPGSPAYCQCSHPSSDMNFILSASHTGLSHTPIAMSPY